MDTIQKELQEATKVGRMSDEDNQVYYKRLFDAANAVPDTQWATFSDATQKWCNAASAAVENGEKIPDFDGEIPDVMAAGGAKEVVADAPAQTKKKKSGGKKKKVAAEAKPAAEETAPAPAKATKTVAKKTEAKPAGKKKEAAAAPAKANGKAKPRATKAAKAADAGKGRKPKFSDDGKIKIVVKENPFRKGTKSEKWFDNYKNGMTVRAAIEAGTPRHHINWDVVLGNISIQ